MSRQHARQTAAETEAERLKRTLCQLRQLRAGLVGQIHGIDRAIAILSDEDVEFHAPGAEHPFPLPKPPLKQET